MSRLATILIKCIKLILDFNLKKKTIVVRDVLSKFFTFLKDLKILKLSNVGIFSLTLNSVISYLVELFYNKQIQMSKHKFV